MCLYNNPNEVKSFLKKHKNHKTVTVYKRLELRCNNLIAPFMGVEYKAGVTKSTSRRTKPCVRWDKISQGIHVYLNYNYALNRRNSGEVVVKMTANIKDLLGLDSGGIAVFKSVKLSKVEYKRYIK